MNTSSKNLKEYKRWLNQKLNNKCPLLVRCGTESDGVRYRPQCIKFSLSKGGVRGLLNLNQNPNPELPSEWVAFTTFGHPLAVLSLPSSAQSIPLSFTYKFIDRVSHSDGPCAVGARRVLNGSKLRFRSVMNAFKTLFSVLLYVPLHFTTKQDVKTS